MNRLKFDEVDRDEDAQEEEERSRDQKDKPDILEW
jgi:hypothetical protein